MGTELVKTMHELIFRQVYIVGEELTFKKLKPSFRHNSS
jgi:hypothetical protein